MIFSRHIGIDYSGAETAEWRRPGLQVFIARDDEAIPNKVVTPAAPAGERLNWNRKEIASWLIAQAQQGERYIAGIDHAFAFPLAYMERHGLTTWDEFLADFAKHWPTDQPNVYVEQFRKNNLRTGSPDELRLTERWTSSAKSVFAWDGQGKVAHSTHAGLPWLRQIRQQAGKRIHFWPFDGWEIPKGKSVIAEVYPAIFKKRYARESRSDHEHDAYAVARWLSDMDQGCVLDRYFDPPLNDEEQAAADLEGWILGIA
jgi:hypothetical protein